jgi:hypothetical protein
MVVMTTRGRGVVLVVALALAAGLLALALGAKPTHAQAQTDTINDRVPVEGVFLNPCTEEFVSFEGTQHLVFHGTEDASGGFHFKGHSNFQLHGVSTSGAKYVIHQISNSHNKEFDVFSESAENFNLTATFQFIRQGSETAEDDFQAKVLWHVTVNANGDVTSEVFEVEEECK